MKLLVVISFILASVLAHAVDLTTIFPDRRADLGSQYFALRPLMPYSLWTNTTVFLTADSPTVNPGATNLLVPDYSFVRTNNAYQTDTNYQPKVVFTNGAWAFVGDGVNDRYNLNGNLSSDKSYYFEVFLPQGASNVLAGTCLIGSTGVSGQDVVGFGGGGTTSAEIIWRGGGTNYTTQYYVGITKYFTNGWVKVCLTRSSPLNRFVFYVGSNVYTSGLQSPVVEVPTQGYHFLGGASSLVTNACNLPVKDLRIFNKALSSNEVFSLFNTQFISEPKIVTQDTSTVFPDRRSTLGSQYFAIRPTMSVSLWTNSLLWLTADSPVMNEGTVNAQWINYSGLIASNGFQSVIAKQPGMVVSNGVKAFVFDGVNDAINISTITNGGILTVTADVFMSSDTNKSCTLFGGGDANSGVGSGWYNDSSTGIRLTYRCANALKNSYVQAVPYPAIVQYFNNSYHNVKLVATTTNATWWFDGVMFGPYTLTGVASTSAVISVVGMHLQGSLGNAYNMSPIRQISISSQ